MYFHHLFPYVASIFVYLPSTAIYISSILFLNTDLSRHLMVGDWVGCRGESRSYEVTNSRTLTKSISTALICVLHLFGGLTANLI